jgi:phospholipid/cholesterol/gamma-HCH transport system ATP-binding protein
VLRDVSCDIYRGKTNVLIGASGCGKTVLIRQVVRLERPDAGQIIVDGTDIAQLGEVELLPFRRKFGMVFQMSALFDSLSVFDNVAFQLREHLHLGPARIRERVMDRLAGLGIEQAAGKMPSELSGGMKKRVAVARALVLEPEILIYDEPTAGLDPIAARSVDDLVLETQARYGVTSIVITHDMTSVFRLADVVHFLHDGRIEISASPNELASSENDAVQKFLQASGVELAHGETHGRG